MKSRRNFLKEIFVITFLPVISACQRAQRVTKTPSIAPSQTSTPTKPTPSLTPSPTTQTPTLQKSATNTPSPTEDIDVYIETVDFKNSQVKIYGFPKGIIKPADGSLPSGIIKGGPYTGDGSFITLKLSGSGLSHLRYVLFLANSIQLYLSDLTNIMTLKIYPYHKNGTYLQKDLLEEVNLFLSSNSGEIFADFGINNARGYRQYSAFCVQLVYRSKVLRLDQFYLISPIEPTTPPSGGGSGGGSDNQPPPPSTEGNEN